MNWVSAVVLAAGASRRMGRQKLLTLFRGKKLVVHSVESAMNSGASEVIVVLGACRREVGEALRGLQVKLVPNPAYLSGQSSSVKAGLRAVSPQAQAAVFLLADQPLVRAGTVRQIIDTYRVHRAMVVYPRFRGRRGNPVLFDRALFREIESLEGDRGAAVLIAKYADRALPVDVNDAGVLMDVDTPEDLARLSRAGEVDLD